MIWVVTNHDATRLSLSRLIAEKGYQVAEIDCGDSIVNRARFQTPALIILDCGVPDSFESLKTLREQPRLNGLPVIMFSIDDQNLENRAMLMGASAYVPKGSLDWAELLVEIVRFAGPPGGRSDA